MFRLAQVKTNSKRMQANLANCWQYSCGNPGRSLDSSSSYLQIIMRWQWWQLEIHFCTFDHLSWWRRSLEKTNLSPSPTAFVPLSIKSNALHINIIQVFDFEHSAQQYTTDYNLTLPFLMRMIPPDWTTTVPFHQYLTSVPPQEERKR